MSTDSPLTPTQNDDLRTIAGMIIPASMEFDVPGADDPAIQADMVATLARDSCGRRWTSLRALPGRRWPVSTRLGVRRWPWSCVRKAGLRWRR
jgi:hypothetical protein